MHIAALTDHTGAEVRGLDLSQPASDDTRQALKAAFVKHHVLAIRGQSLEPRQLVLPEGDQFIGQRVLFCGAHYGYTLPRSATPGQPFSAVCVAIAATFIWSGVKVPKPLASRSCRMGLRCGWPKRCAVKLTIGQ